MKCPICESKSRIFESRQKGDWKRRLHICWNPDCRYTFVTYEIVPYDLYQKLEERFPELSHELAEFVNEEFPEYERKHRI